MAVLKLDIQNFRNLSAVQLEPLATGFNLLYGLNGSGKTSVLEAIYYLSLGRSFRSTLTGRLVRHTSNQFNLFAQVAPQLEQSFPIGIERSLQGETQIRIAGKDAQSVAELADLTPIQLINSNCYNLIDAGPLFRRKYLDWGIFYRESQFLRIWKDYMQVLRQRNAALRHASKSELDVWTQELIHKGEQLAEFRRDYVQQLLPVLYETLAALLPIQAVEISYQQGWEKGGVYADILAASLAKDRLQGYTQYGPHRADLRITINRVTAKDILSRGQQKLFVCAMILAQGVLLKTGTNKQPIYLVDDLPAELDKVSRQNLITLLSQQQTQVFVTAIERETLSDALQSLPLRMFHVEHGEVEAEKEYECRM